MTIEHTLISFFGSTTYVAKNIAAKVINRVHLGIIPKNQANKFPRIFLERSGKDKIANLDGTGKQDYVEDIFALEIISNHSSDVSTITGLLWSDVDLHYGFISATKTVKGLFVTNQDDDYIPKGIGSDIGIDISAFQLRIVHDNTTT